MVASRPIIAALCFAPLLAGATISTAAADEPADKPWRETWLGGDASSHVWLLYSGTTLAPMGDLWSNGARLRIVGGYGQYDVRYGKRDYAVRTTFTDAMVGYQMRFGALTAKAFAGATFITVDAAAHDGTRALSQPALGGKVALELWLDAGERAWMALDTSAATAHDSFSARLRYGWRALPPLSVGPEAILNGNDLWVDRTGVDAKGPIERALHNDVRFGGFARFNWTGGEISISGGIAGDIDRPAVPYGTLNASLQF